MACAPAIAPAPAAPAPSAPAAPGQPAPSPAVAAPKRGGIIAYAQRAVLQTLHPWKGDITITRAFSGVYEPLLRMDHREGVDFRRERELKPGLAERWENVDPTTFVFHLRKNVKWHDGKPFTADDVVYSLETWTDAAKAPEPRRSVGGLVATVEATDPFTVKVTTKRVSADFLGMFAFQRNVFIGPKHVEDLAKTVVGTGPFKVVKATPTSVIIVERNPDFYLPERPYLDGGKVFVGMEEQQQQAAFIAKELDLINLGDQAQFDALKKQVPEAKTPPYLQPNGYSLYPRQDRPPFNDLRVRKALHLAIDRQGLIKTATFGAGGINPPGGLGLHAFSIPQEELLKLPGYRQPKDADIAEAKRLLAEAGYPQGFKFGIQSPRDAVGTPALVEATAHQLKAAGIDAEVLLQERAVFLENQRNGDFDAWLNVIHSDPPSEGLQAFYHSKGTLNKGGINDAELDALIDEQDRTLDRKRAGELNQRIQRIVLEKLYTIPAVELPAFAFWHPWLRDYPLSYSAQPYIPQWEGTWVDTDKAPRRNLQ